MQNLPRLPSLPLALKRWFPSWRPVRRADAERLTPRPPSGSAVRWSLGLPFLLAVGLALAPVADAATTVKLGAVRQIARATDLDLEGDFVYAINFSANDPPRTVRGVTFVPDTQAIPGATLIGPQQVTPWQTKPEFGATPDDDQLEEILHDIRWANDGSGERLRATLAVTAGEEYKLQILISANGSENRRWDIRVGGQEAVDEITSLGVSPGESYAIDRATLFTCQFIAASTSLVIEMGNLFGAHDGGDRNPIWQALTLERVTVPPTPEALALEPDRFFPTQTGPIGALRAADRKFAATHRFAFVPGPGDDDNSKFAIDQTTLFAADFDFASVPPGTVFSIRVRATDAADPQRFLDRPLTVTVVAPHAPVSLALDAGAISTLAQPGALVARIRVEDPDDFDRHALTLAVGPGDADNGLFVVADGALRLAQRPPAGKPSAAVRLRATDRSGLACETSFLLPFLAPQVRINEIVASGVAGLPDESAVPQDWIEIFNGGAQHIDLAGWFLTDDREDLRRWPFPASSIAPQGFLLVLADGRGASPEGSTKLHANFSLAMEGEWVTLVQPDGATLASAFAFPTQYPGVSYGYGSDGRPGHLPRPTPAEPNGPIAEAGANEVTFSRPHGFYASAFDLELSAAIPGSTIRYTADGTAPTPATGTLYTQPIAVRPDPTGLTRGTRIIRAIAVHPTAAYAPVATQTYLFVNGVAGPGLDGIVSQSQLVASITRHAIYGPLLDDAFLALPAVSVVLRQGPDSVERPVSIELFDPQAREAGFQIDCGLEATGTSSLGSPKLSLAAHFRSDYGQARLRYPVFARGSLFPDRAATAFDELRLRSHSHDTFFWLATSENPPVPYGNPPVTRSGDAQLLRNLWMDEMQLALGQPGKHGRQVHLFLNGAYHGIYHVHEHATDDFLASYYPGAREDFHFTTAALSGSTHGPSDSWRMAWDNVKASTDNLTEARRWIDLTNLCDYMLLSFYAGNDWDWTAQHNWAAAGPRLPDRGGWKFFAQDSDLVLQDVAADCTDQDVPDGLFQRLMRFPDFRVLFRDRVYRHCFGNGVLTPAQAAARYDTRMNEIAIALVAETARWQPGSSVAPLPWDRDQEWANEWRYLRETFFPQRTARLLEQLRQHAGWWPVEPPAPSSPGGLVPIGFQVTYTTARGTVYVTTDGSDPRLPGGDVNPAARPLTGGTATLSLVPAGSVWRFLDDGTDPGPEWNLAGFDDSAWRSGPAEIGYGDGNETTLARFVDTDPQTEGVQKNLTTFFRRTFDVTNLRDLSVLKMRLLCDDGTVVYLNGREIWRANLPEGVIAPTTPAVTAISSIDEFTYLEQTLGAADVGLRSVGNLLAVEIHQQDPASPDISFDFALSGTGTLASQVVILDRPTLVRARTRSGSEWSAAVDTYFVPEGFPRPSAANLTLTEIHYHPLDAPDAEFLEFANTSNASVDLSEVVLTNAVFFRFPAATVLEAGARLVVAKDPAAFNERYAVATSPYFRDGLHALGPWVGSLSNAGETIEIRAPDGSLLFACAYGTEGDWPTQADGHGSSLELLGPADAPATPEAKTIWLSDPLNWRPSATFHGSPGAPVPDLDHRVVIDEILAAPADGQGDAVELFNAGDAPVDLSGWCLSDSNADYRKFRFPGGTLLSAGARLVLRESDFNNPANPSNPAPFALSSQGDEVFLVQTDPTGALLFLVDHIEFGPTPRGISLGRFPDATGPPVWLEAPSLGVPNGPPLPGYAAWSATAFPMETPGDERLPEVDLDGDGLNNFAEYAFALLPHRASPSPLAVTTWPGLGGFGFVYRIRTVAPELSYQVEVSADLQTWDHSEAEVETLSRTAQPDGSTLVTARVRPTPPGSGPARFVRVVVR